MGYTNYADNVVRFFVAASGARSGIDMFRVFDSLNWVENMRVAIDAVLETGALCEAAICYTGDIFDPSRPKYNLKYYVDMAKELERAGAHVLGIKDMAGVCRPRAARELVRGAEAGGRPADPLPHPRHQRHLRRERARRGRGRRGRGRRRDGFDERAHLATESRRHRGGACGIGARSWHRMSTAMQAISHYWEGVRRYYAPFEADMRSGTTDVYRHEMPGGQYTNLREQARAMGLEHRWPEVSKAYAEVNKLFGDIVKVTPTSKVVGDMALFMVANDLTAADVRNPEQRDRLPRFRGRALPRRDRASAGRLSEGTPAPYSQGTGTA